MPPASSATVNVDPAIGLASGPMSITSRNLLLVFVGGAGGTALRWIVGLGTDSVGISPLVGLLVVNAAGAFVLGWFVATNRWMANDINALFAVGVLGSFTTFSAYSMAVVELVNDNAEFGAILLGLGSVVVGLACAVAGRLVGGRA